MSNCISLIAHPVTEAEVICWRCVSDMREVIETQRLKNFCVRRGEYQADECVFEKLDCRIVSAVVLHECSGNGAVDQLMLWQKPTVSLIQEGDDVRLCMNCWSIAAAPVKNEPTTELERKGTETVCEKYERFRCVLDAWLLGDRTASYSDGTISISYSAADCEKLEKRVNQLKVACDRSKCRRPRRYVTFSH